MNGNFSHTGLDDGPQHRSDPAGGPGRHYAVDQAIIPLGQGFRPYNPHRLALTPGTRLGPYEVTAQIGEGGMGEVYRATDTNLKRSVAIKVLPASVAG